MNSNDPRRGTRFRRLVLLCSLFLFALQTAGENGRAWAKFGKKDEANSCITCHQSLKEEKLSRPATLWAQSVHADVGNTCDGCHGGDPKSPGRESMAKENRFYAAPAPEEVAEFCGKCHREVADRFAESQHAASGEINCITCHGSHSIRRISIDIINPDQCTQCHDYQEPEKLRNLLKGLHDAFYEQRQRLQRVTGFPTGAAKKDLDAVWSKLRNVRMASHSFTVEDLQPLAAKVKNSLDENEKEISRLEEMESGRKGWGAGAVIVFTLLAVLMHRYNRENGAGE